MRDIHDDLVSAQKTDVKPAMQAIFTSKDGLTTYDYSFDPAVTTNRLERIEYGEEPYNDYAKIVLRNNDLAVPSTALSNLEGYYVDLGIGADCSGTLRYGTYPRLWVKRQHPLSGGIKGQMANLKVILELQGVWSMLRELFVLLGDPPFYNDNNGLLTGKTIYEILEYLIETTLSDLTGFTFTLDALGDQDDTIINSLVLESTKDPENPLINKNAPETYETFADIFERLLDYTGCYLRAKDGLAFKIIYPQTTDAVDEDYHSSISAGHVFYENTERLFIKAPNRVKVFSDQSEAGDWSEYFTGEAFGTDYTDEVFTGEYVPITEIITDSKGVLTSSVMADQLAAFNLSKHSAETFGGRTIVPHDARVELYDRVQIQDSRGL